MMKNLNIVVPTDFSECSLGGLRKAVELATETGGTVRLLHVVSELSLEAVGRDIATSHRVLKGTLLRDVEEQFSRMIPLLKGCEYKTAIHVGRASRAIVAYANKVKADIIVMSTHGRHGFARVFLGSTAEEVVRRAPCPVLTVHPHGEAMKVAV